MFLLVRLMFWLGLVFAFLPWPEGSGPKQAAAWLRGGAQAAGEGALASLAAEAERRAVEACARSPGACLEATARFARLARPADGAPEAAHESPIGGAGRAEARQAEAHDAPKTPMPPHAPRPPKAAKPAP